MKLTFPFFGGGVCLPPKRTKRLVYSELKRLRFELEVPAAFLFKHSARPNHVQRNNEVLPSQLLIKGKRLQMPILGNNGTSDSELRRVSERAAHHATSRHVMSRRCRFPRRRTGMIYESVPASGYTRRASSECRGGNHL